MKAIFLDRATIDPSINLDEIAAQFDDFYDYPTTSPEQVIERANGSDVIITNKVVLDVSVIEKLPRLKLICITATGTNNVDLDAARAAGVVVTNVSGYSTQSVSQYLFAFLLGHMHQVPFYRQNNLEKPWDKAKTFCQIDAPINELSGKTIGILGFGSIGQQVATIAQAFGMTVLIGERKGQNQVREGRVSFEDMLANADIVSLHCPLTAETENLFDRQVFTRMKQGSILINTGRGPLVNSKDLAEALESGQLGHAIIDVLEQEPPPADHPLLNRQLKNLTLTHHIAWGSLQAQQRLIQETSKNIIAFNSGIPRNRV